jgi:ribosome recycling factor
MNENTEETLEQNTENAVLKAITELSNKFENLEKVVNIQFEAIREGIVYNSAKFDRLTAEVYEARTDISKIRASLTELTEEVRQNRKSLV